MWSVELAVMAVMIGLNSIFAGYEIALASISLARLESLVRENRAGAKASLAMKKNIERSLAAVQTGITLFGAIAAATGGAGAEQALVPLLAQFGLSSSATYIISISLVVVPLTVTTIVLGELVPKVFSLRNNTWVCLRLSPVMLWITRVFAPVVWLLEKSAALITRWGERRLRARPDGGAKPEAVELQELRAIAALARTSQLIGAREESIIVNAVRLSTRPVRESMLRAEHINMLYVDSTLAEALVAGHLDLHTRFPVTERLGDPQAIVGYVNFKDIVACMRLAGHNPSLRSVVRPIFAMQDDMPLSSCLERMMREHTHIALLRNKEEKVVGMITLEDIIEELVGEIQDEYDRLPLHVKNAGAGWVVGGGVPLTRLVELTGIKLTLDGASDVASAPSSPRTLNDWVTARLGRSVRGGDIVNQGDVTVIVRNVRRQNVYEAQIRAEP